MYTPFSRVVARTHATPTIESFDKFFNYRQKTLHQMFTGILAVPLLSIHSFIDEHNWKTDFGSRFTYLKENMHSK